MVHVQQRPFLALGLRLLAMALLAAMLLLVKISGDRGIALPEAMFWRQCLPALALTGWLGARGGRGSTGGLSAPGQVRRAVIGTVGMFLTLGVVRVLPLAEATILGFTTPIFAVLLATLFLREHVGPWRWGAVLLGLVGVAVIAGPNRAHMPLFGLAVGLGAAFFVALVSIQLRDLGRTEEPIRIVFWFSALGAVMLSPGLILTGHAHTLAGWLLLGGIGLTGLFAQLCMTAALRYGSVTAVVTMDYSQLAWATLWGWLFFGQLPPASTWFIAWREQVRHHRTALDPQGAPNAD